jgi:bifunctional non-homologous end joining protein LigD
MTAPARSRSRRAPSGTRRAAAARPPRRRLTLPTDVDTVQLRFGTRTVSLTNLRKPFWRQPLITKGALLQYYADVSGWLLPHLRDRAMVMKRYPDGAAGDFFFMKQAPDNRPEWLSVCRIEHKGGRQVEYPMVQDLPALLWVVNLGCIDLNQWYATCDDVDRPDAINFDLDPVEGTPFERVCETALLVQAALRELGMDCLVKTTGASGLHVYVPLQRGPTQATVWRFAKQFAVALEARHRDLITTTFRVAERPANHVLLDYNQNAWGRTLASVYSVRPQPRAPVSMPLRWSELRRGVAVEDFRLDNAPRRLARSGDLWAPLLSARRRARLPENL